MSQPSFANKGLFKAALPKEAANDPAFGSAILSPATLGLLRAKATNCDTGQVDASREAQLVESAVAAAGFAGMTPRSWVQSVLDSNPAGSRPHDLASQVLNEFDDGTATPWNPGSSFNNLRAECGVGGQGGDGALVEAAQLAASARHAQYMRADAAVFDSAIGEHIGCIDSSRAELADMLMSKEVNRTEPANVGRLVELIANAQFAGVMADGDCGARQRFVDSGGTTVEEFDKTESAMQYRQLRASIEQELAGPPKMPNEDPADYTQRVAGARHDVVQRKVKELEAISERTTAKLDYSVPVQPMMTGGSGRFGSGAPPRPSSATAARCGRSRGGRRLTTV
jgi:hypothetical protein